MLNHVIRRSVASVLEHVLCKEIDSPSRPARTVGESSEMCEDPSPAHVRAVTSTPLWNVVG
jgi:hypothetical protein